MGDKVDLGVRRLVAVVRTGAERRRVESGRPNAPGRSTWVEYRRRRASLDGVALPWRAWARSVAAVAAGVGLVGLVGSWAPVPMLAALAVLSCLAVVEMAAGRLDEEALWPYDRSLASWCTARCLSRLERRGWVVLHDRVVPGSDVRVDHVAIGPSGVWVLASERCEGRVAALDDGWWYVAGLARCRRVERVGTDTAAAAGAGVVMALSDAMSAHDLDAALVALGVWGARVPGRGLVVDGVAVVPARRLAAMVAASEVRLSPDAVSDIAALARARLPEVLLGRVLDAVAA